VSEHDFPSTWVWRVIEEFIRSRVGLHSSRVVLSGKGAWDDIVAYCFNAVLTSLLSSNISLLTHPHSMQKQNNPISFVALPFQSNSSYCSSNIKAKIRPVFSGTIPEIRLILDFVPVFLFLRFYFVFLMMFSGIVGFLESCWRLSRQEDGNSAAH